MSEIKFENRYILTKETLLEYMNVFTFTSPLLLVLTSIFLLFVFITAKFFGLIVSLGYILLLTGGLYLRNTHASKEQVAREAEMYGQREILLRIDNGITATNEKTGGSLHFDLSQISTFKQTKNLLILISSAKNHLIFRKDSFTIGTYEEFVSYLNACYPYFHLGQKSIYDRDKRT